MPQSLYGILTKARIYAGSLQSLMGKELMDTLKKAKGIKDNIDHGVSEYGVDNISAYEESISTN